MDVGVNKLREVYDQTNTSKSFDVWIKDAYSNNFVFKWACKNDSSLAKEMLQSRDVVPKSWARLVYQYGSDDLLPLVPSNSHWAIQYNRWDTVEKFTPDDFLTAIQYKKVALIKKLIDLGITKQVPLRAIVQTLDDFETFTMVWPYYNENPKVVFLNAIRKGSPVVDYLLDHVDLPDLDIDDLYLCLESNLNLRHPKFTDLVRDNLGKLFDFSVHIWNHKFIEYFRSFNIPIEVKRDTLLKLIRENAINLITLPILRDSVKKWVVEMFDCAFANGRGNVIDYLLPFDPVCTQDYIRVLIQRKKWAIINFHNRSHNLRDLVQDPTEFMNHDTLLVRNIFGNQQ